MQSGIGEREREQHPRHYVSSLVIQERAPGLRSLSKTCFGLEEEAPRRNALLPLSLLSQRSRWDSGGAQPVA